MYFWNVELAYREQCHKLSRPLPSDTKPVNKGPSISSICKLKFAVLQQIESPDQLIVSA